MTDTQQYPDANDILMGGGGYPTLKLDQLRVWVGGTIVSKPTTRQETEFGTGKPKTYPKSGDPIMGILVDVQTDQRTDTEDDGIRRLYVEGKRLKDAIRDGILAVGAPGLEIGGALWVAWTGTEQGQGATPAKTYESRYRMPSTPVPGSNGQAAPMGEPMPEPPPAGGPAATAGTAAAPAAPATSPVPAPAPMSPPPVPAPVAPAPMPEPGAQSAAPAAPAPAANEPTAEAIAALKAAGLDPQQVFPNYQG